LLVPLYSSEAQAFDSRFLEEDLAWCMVCLTPLSASSLGRYRHIISKANQGDYLAGRTGSSVGRRLRGGARTGMESVFGAV
jgi:hypothetical protein